ncbi:MAG: DUF386 domain-containing protein [Clostridiales bacterium]|nr:DUF386 domain-containing protein [Clostridiales bacterium]
MVLDKLNNSNMYYVLNDKFENAFEFIKKATKENLPVGKYEIDGDNLYGLVQEYTTKLEEEGKFEGHRKYIDIQYIISGIEIIETVNISKAIANTEYNEIKDIEFYENNEKGCRHILEAEEYAILYPEDIHKPGMSINNKQTNVKKIVVKVKI